jgi:microcystin degradation protein MlrC
MAVLETGGVRVVVTTKRMQALDLAPFRHVGVEPTAEKILALKSTCHFRGDFQPIAEAVIVVLAPGYYGADPALYPYTKLRPGVRLRPLGPDRVA